MSYLWNYQLENVLLSEEGYVKLCDFGLVRRRPESLTFFDPADPNILSTLRQAKGLSSSNSNGQIGRENDIEMSDMSSVFNPSAEETEGLRPLSPTVTAQWYR